MVTQGGKLQLPIWRFELSVEKKVVINGDVHVHTLLRMIYAREEQLKVIPLISLTTYVSAGQKRARVAPWVRGIVGTGAAGRVTVSERHGGMFRFPTEARAAASACVPHKWL